MESKNERDGRMDGVDVGGERRRKQNAMLTFRVSP